MRKRAYFVVPKNAPPLFFTTPLQPTLSKPTEKEPFSSSGKRVVTSPLSLARCYWFIYGALVRQSGGYEPKTGKSAIRPLLDYPTAVNNIKNVLPCVSDRVFMKRQAFFTAFHAIMKVFMTSVTFPMPFLVYNLRIRLYTSGRQIIISSRKFWQAAEFSA